MTDYVVVKLPFNVDNEDTAKDLVTTARMFREATQNMLLLARHRELPVGPMGWVDTFGGVAYEVIPNRRYANGAAILVMGIYIACKTLGIDFKSVELSDWLAFQQGTFARPSENNIALNSDHAFYIATAGSAGKRRIITPAIPPEHDDLLGNVFARDVKYAAMIVINKYDTSWASGVVRMMIPLNFYNQYIRMKKQGDNNLVGGVSISTDKIDLVILDEKGEINDHMAISLSDTRDYNMGEKIHHLLNHARNRGVGVLFMEDLTIYDKMRFIQPKGGTEEFKALALKGEIIEEIAMKSHQYDIEVGYVNPKVVLGKHDTAYLIATRGWEQLIKSNNTMVAKQ